ncbi:CinA family protein [Polynucleobacter sp. AP-Nino-20-G2]|uniref:CinA family protein n=1 Tax=Polynucleobacter sp. AP-Nino-20-G2 TaxID=2576917 RepID=UPI001BFD2AC6|nr:CinA family protein [Polynucleobacter sp. AP-Nino-20-G2]QWE16864.1 CinA family protein [Polynucleobacter sp. AP-Nino-20-G2]
MKNNIDPQHEVARAIAHVLLGRAWKIALAESCTGGLVCATLTDLAGSSEWFERGFITYSNQAKIECLDVPAETIQSFGAVSEEVARAMAEGAASKAKADAAISITGIAGPSGGSVEKPVGTVCFGWALKGHEQNNVTEIITATKHFDGDRQTVREQARDYALSKFLELLKPKNA